MNIEALTNDINDVLEKHGVSVEEQKRWAAVLELTKSKAGQVFMERATAGASLFAVDDSGMTSLMSAPSPTNGLLLNQVLMTLPPHALRLFLQAVLYDLHSIGVTCNCDACRAFRASVPLSKFEFSEVQG